MRVAGSRDPRGPPRHQYQLRPLQNVHGQGGRHRVQVREPARAAVLRRHRRQGEGAPLERRAAAQPGDVDSERLDSQAIGRSAPVRNEGRGDGGAARLRAVKTITVAGYGEAAYMNGGGNISASPDAPQKWISIPDYEKTIDLEHGRLRVRQRNHQNFVFAGLAGYLGTPNAAVATLDGDVAYNLGGNGRAVRAGQQAVRA